MNSRKMDMLIKLGVDNISSVKVTCSKYKDDNGVFHCPMCKSKTNGPRHGRDHKCPSCDQEMIVHGNALTIKLS